MGTRTIEFRLNRTFEIEIDTNITDEDEIMELACEQIEDNIVSNNETIENAFFEALEMVE